MSILTIYLVTLGVGGGLLLLTVLLGGDSDAEADADLDASADVDADAGIDGGGADASHAPAFDGLWAWLPLASGRFWIFFLAGFGLVGTVLTAAELGSFGVNLGAAIAVGYVAGGAMAWVMRRLKANEVSSGIGERDYLGAHATVILPVKKGRQGRVRLELGGRAIDLIAETEDEAELAAGQSAVVYGTREDGTVVITRTEDLP